FVASAAGDVFILDEGKATYANVYVLCVGKTGTKKSTGADFVDEHIRRNYPEGRPQAHVADSVSSGEGLIRLLQQRKNVLLQCDEMADLLAIAARSGQRLEPLLNKAIDLKPLSATVKRASESLEATNYCLNVCGNATPDHVRLQ